MPAYWAVERRKLLTKGAQIKKPVNLPQQVVGRNPSHRINRR